MHESTLGLVVVGYSELSSPARHLVGVGDELYAGCDDGGVLVFHERSSQVIRRFSSPVTALGADRNTLVFGSLRGVGEVRDRQHRSPVTTFDHGQPITAVHADGHLTAVAAGSHVNLAYDPELASLDAGIGAITAIVAADGGWTLVAGVHGVCWSDPRRHCTDGSLELPTIVAAAACPDRSCIALGDLGGSIHLVGRHTDVVYELTGYPDRVHVVHWLGDGGGLCAAADDEMTVWTPGEEGWGADLEPNRLLAHDTAITALAASSGQFVATGDAAGAVVLWAPRQAGHPIARVHAGATVLALAWFRSDRSLAVSTTDAKLVRFDVVRW